MLCKMCALMLRSQVGYVWKGTHDLLFDHHKSVNSLRHSREMGCGICHILFEELQSPSCSDQLELSIEASLSVLDHPRLRNSYQLIFKMKHGEFRGRRAFVLSETSPDHAFRTPFSSDTSSDEVYQLSKQWMSKCKCTKSEPPSWYPARLISLDQIKMQLLKKRTDESMDQHKEELMVKLVETAEWGKGRSKQAHYVTLSHCWGSQEKAAKQIKLTSGNIHSFKQGLPLNRLSKTFQDAIQFAARISEVGYLWIDSLCIKQGPEEKEDWLRQSADMDRVYSNTFLNISATAATNSDDGLFFAREPEQLMAHEVVVNIDGIPCARHEDLVFKAPGVLKGEEGLLNDGKYLRCCTILDASFWTNDVENAPVNRRGWVLQERLMSPRVLHFCRNQVAWECAEFFASEGQPHGIPNIQMITGRIGEESRLGGLDPMKDGKRLREIRLDGYEDPDTHLIPREIYALELWRRIVEVYSKTTLTKSTDKLIALSGIARLMAGKIGSPDKPAVYVAGLWETHLASQLLWKVDPIFHHIDKKFEIPTTSPEDGRAPSFSWASINAEKGHGITYAEITDQDLFIKVEAVQIEPEMNDNPYGMIKEGHLIIWGKLRKAVFSKKPKGRYGWMLLERGDLSEEVHTNVYLDCPERDERRILGPDAEIYIVPASKGERTASEESKYLICLILQLDKEHPEKAFRRVGLTKLSPWGDYKAMQDYRILEVHRGDECLPHHGYDKDFGVHRILLV